MFVPLCTSRICWQNLCQTLWGLHATRLQAYRLCSQCERGTASLQDVRRQDILSPCEVTAVSTAERTYLSPRQIVQGQDTLSTAPRVLGTQALRDVHNRPWSFWRVGVQGGIGLALLHRVANCATSPWRRHHATRFGTWCSHGCGDCPASMQSIRAVVKPPSTSMGWEVLGIEDGFEGSSSRQGQVVGPHRCPWLAPARVARCWAVQSANPSTTKSQAFTITVHKS